MKTTLCLDFDGVLNSYTSGWTGPSSIPDPPVPGAIEAVKEYMKHFTVCIHSSRFNEANNSLDRGYNKTMIAVKAWLVQHGIDSDQIVTDGDLAASEPSDGLIYLVATKPPAFVTIDDRAITFTGDFPSVEALLAFKPWNKQ